MAKKKKPAPISMRLHKEVPAPAVPVAKGINEDSPIVTRQIERLERKVETLSSRTTPAPNVQVEAPNVQVTVPARARIAKVTIKYDPLGFPSELIPQYAEPAV